MPSLRSRLKKGYNKLITGTQRVERNKFGRMVDVLTPKQQKRKDKRKKLESMIRQGYRP